MNKKNNITVQPVSDSYMNLNTGSVLYDSVETIMDFCMLYPLFAMILYAFTKSNVYIIRGYFLIIAVFLMLLIRNYVYNNLLHYISYIPVIVLTYFISGNIIAKVVNTLFIIIMMGISIKKRKEEHAEFRKVNYLLMSEIFLLGIYLISIKLNFTLVQSLIIYSSILLCIICLIYTHISRLDTLMKWEGQKSEGDKKKISSIGIRTSIFIMSILMIFTFVLYSQNYFKNVDSAFVSWISSTFSPLPQHTEQQLQQNNTMNDNMNIDLPDELKKPAGKNIFISIIISVIECMAGLLVAMLVYIALKTLLKKLIELAFGRKEKNNEQKVSLLKISDLKDSIKDMYKLLKRSGIPSLSMSNNNRIRRAYYTLVTKRKRRDTVIMPSYTPLVIRSIVKSDSDIDIKTATYIYEKARYGNTECTDEEVDRIRSDVKHKEGGKN